MTVSEKFKTIDNKIKQNKAQYDLDRQTTKIYHQEMLVNMNFWWQRYFTRKRLARKSCYNKKIWILSIRQRIKYQGLIKFFRSYEKEELVTIKKEKPTIKKFKSDLIYNTNYSLIIFSWY